MGLAPTSVSHISIGQGMPSLWSMYHKQKAFNDYFICLIYKWSTNGLILALNWESDKKGNLCLLQRAAELVKQYHLSPEVTVDVSTMPRDHQCCAQLIAKKKSICIFYLHLSTGDHWLQMLVLKFSFCQRVTINQQVQCNLCTISKPKNLLL